MNEQSEQALHGGEWEIPTGSPRKQIDNLHTGYSKVSSQWYYYIYNLNQVKNITKLNGTVGLTTYTKIY